MALKALEIIGCLIYFGAVFILPLFSISLLVGLLFTRFYFLSILYVAWYFYDKNTPHKAGRRYSIIRKLPIWKWIASYFPINLYKTADLDPSKNYLFALSPHGILVHGGAVNFLSDATGFDKLFPGISVHFSLIEGHFYMPIHRECFMAAGLTPASAHGLEYKLTKVGPGSSVTIVVGGAPELKLSSMTEYRLFILKRKGFIKLALRNNIPIVPVFTFGETKTYRFCDIDTVNSWFWRMVGGVLGSKAPKQILLGRFGLMPFQNEINTVVGSPIYFTPMAEGISRHEQDSYIDACHGQYLSALKKLYEDHKKRFGDADTPLIFT